MRFICRGFNLLELLIVLAIISILAAISYPSYQNYQLKTHRALAKIALMHLAAKLEQHYTLENTYQTAKLTNLGVMPTVANNHYQLQIVSANSNQFLIRAVPLGQQMADRECGNLSLDQNGVQSISGTGSTSNCWLK